MTIDAVLTAASVVAGLALLLWTIRDVFKTVFVIGGGAGRQSGLIASLLWRAALRLHDPSSESSHSKLRAAGPTIVLIILVVWIAQLMVSWALIFVPDAFALPGSVTFGDRFVFAGRTVVGRGGNTPTLDTAGGSWEVLHGVAGLSGVTMISLGLAYVLPILAGVAQKRGVAAQISCLGNSAPEIRDLVDRTGGGQVELHLIALVAPITVAAERHRSYPVLHYFHSHDRHAALATAIAMLVIFLEDGAGRAPDIDASVTEPLFRAIRDLLDALASMGLERYATELDLSTGLDDIRLSADGRSGVTTPPNRGWLEAYVRFDGWRWDDIDG